MSDERGNASSEEMNKWYETCVEASDDSIYVVDRDGKYVLANDEHLSRLKNDGRISSEDEIPGKNIEEVHPDEDLEKLKSNIEKILETGESEKEEHYFPSAERWSNRTYSPVKDEETGQIKGVAVVSKDITARKEAEEQEEFLHSLLRHDVKNKVQVAEGWLELMEDSDLSEEVEDYLDKSKKGLDEGIDIIEKIKKIREAPEDSVREMNINPIIEGVLSEYKPNAYEKGIDVEYNSKNCEVKGGDLLDEMLSNLVGNSIKHSGGEKIRIKTEDYDERVRISIEDDGKGISDECKEMIFEKKFKKDSDGSGLGTYVVKKIAENYGGEVEIEDSELGGAKFDVYLEKA